MLYMFLWIILLCVLACLDLLQTTWEMEIRRNDILVCRWLYAMLNRFYRNKNFRFTNINPHVYAYG